MRVDLLTILILISIDVAAQNIGDISFDAKTDDPNFTVCNPSRVLQTYELKTKMDETPLAVQREFRAKFVPKDEWKYESGIIRIRFLVNCSGKADRFRLLELDFDIHQKQFSESLRAHVVQVAKSMQWPTRRAWNQTVDYYHYFSIKIVDGQLADVIQ